MITAIVVDVGVVASRTGDPARAVAITGPSITDASGKPMFTQVVSSPASVPSVQFVDARPVLSVLADVGESCPPGLWVAHVTTMPRRASRRLGGAGRRWAGRGY